MKADNKNITMGFQCQEFHVTEEMKQQAYHSTIGGQAGGKNSAFSLSAFAARQSAATARRRQPSAFLHAFTLLEVMIAVTLFGLVMAGTIEVYIICNKLWHTTSLSMDTSRMASLAIQRMASGVGTNDGLRAVAIVTLNTNVGGHPYTITNYYWNTGIGPPSADDPAHYVHVGCSYTPDGSWRLTFSNTCIDYNIKQRNILFCPDTNQTGAARQKRILICNYVSAATVTNNANGTVKIQLTVWKQVGMFVASNTASMFVQKRNN